MNGLLGYHYFCVIGPTLIETLHMFLKEIGVTPPAPFAPILTNAPVNDFSGNCVEFVVFLTIFVYFFPLTIVTPTFEEITFLSLSNRNVSVCIFTYKMHTR